jgi:hypothetical protein
MKQQKTTDKKAKQEQENASLSELLLLPALVLVLHRN